MSNTKNLTARELIEKGLREAQFENAFPGGVSPEAEETAAEEEANRRRNRERAALSFRELYARGVRVLEEPAEPTAPTGVPPSPAESAAVNPLSEEARLAREAALDRLAERTWPGRQSAE